MPMNLVADLGLDCPSCREYDRCTDDCICPVCWWPARYQESERDSAVVAWRFFAPVTSAMNGEGLDWGWATEEKGHSRIACSLELTIPNSRDWCEVARSGDLFVASYWCMKESGSWDMPPEPVMLDELVAHNSDEVVNFVQNCTHASREKV